MNINKDTVLCMSLAARPGNFGTRFHNYLYDRMNLNFVYKAFTTTDIRAAIGGIRALGVRGCAVSMPFKESCMEFLDGLHPSAEAVRSVNTIVNDSGKLIGWNTDYVAVRELLAVQSISRESAFLLAGSGGMAKAVACALKDLGFLNGTVVARNPKTGRSLAEQCNYQWLSETAKSAPILINASPVGMAGGPEAQQIPFSAAQISDSELIMDVVAIPDPTLLIEAAKKANKLLITGTEITMRQSLEQFVLYTGMRPAAELAAEASLFAKS